MEIVIYIPDEMFEAGERLTRRTKKSRTRLFSDAVKEYLQRLGQEEVTEAMNRACAESGSATDPFVMTPVRETLKRIEW